MAGQVCESIFLKAIYNEQGPQQPKDIVDDQKKGVDGEHWNQALHSGRAESTSHIFTKVLIVREAISTNHNICDSLGQFLVNVLTYQDHTGVLVKAIKVEVGSIIVPSKYR